MPFYDYFILFEEKEGIKLRVLLKRISLKIVHFSFIPPV